MSQAAADNDTQIHQAVSNNGVCDEAYHRKDKEWTKPTVRGSTGQQREQEICCETAGAEDEKSYSEILQLGARLTSGATPFHYEHA
jgi:hypothetical protein